MVSPVRWCAVDAIRNYIEVGAAEGAGITISKQGDVKHDLQIDF
jgi:hypothetical protein